MEGEASVVLGRQEWQVRFSDGSIATHAPVRVSVRNLNGKAVIRFKDVPLKRVDSLTEALHDGVPTVGKAA